MFVEALWRDPASYFMWVTVVAFSVCIHEFTHAWVAMREGDLTAYRLGYLTMNPMKVMGPQSLFMLFVCGIAWGMVPVNRAAMRRRISPVLVACSGPASNLLLALAFAFVAAAVHRTVDASGSNPFMQLFATGVRANLLLFIFNMLPIPILDGWSLYEMLFPALRRVSQQSRGTISLVAILVVFFSPLRMVLWAAIGAGEDAVLGGMLRMLSIFS